MPKKLVERGTGFSTKAKGQHAPQQTMQREKERNLVHYYATKSKLSLDTGTNSTRAAATKN